MKIIELKLGGTYTVYGYTFFNGVKEKVANEKANYLLSTGHFKLIDSIEVKKKEK
ncbi:YqbF domain-containing protein [Bacillus thuringiensis]|uniref:Uncharacterized protein YqbF N-terminal domain-containing protein n=1 Tax=Bacillus cereus TaxID=1396 RepID=A0AAN5XLG5_BACCE|nr:YqbF domain-containing protein [Bacillus cereus]KAB2447063.1 hypothetical protein F8165_26260 [Bacillus cereus]KAB2486373.1 hypothetical protein F8157_12780 [Bacillus cereus]